jgi:hypothetical protein
MKARGFALALWALIYSSLLSPVPTASADTNPVPGWTVTKTTEHGQTVESCIATWNNGGPNELTIEALGGLLTLSISSPAFGQEKLEEIVSLSKAGMGKLQRRARVAAGICSITIDDEVDSYLEKDGPLFLEIKGVNYSFSVANTPSAIDAVRRCVGEPTKADMAAQQEPSFSVPSGWESFNMAAGCAARLKGNEVDTLVTINNKDQTLLLAGRKDWNSWGEQIKLTLQIDSKPPLSLEGWKWSNLALVLLADDKDVASLRKASVLRWHLPTGDYSATVHDLGSALDAAAACTKKKRLSTPH